MHKPRCTQKQRRPPEKRGGRYRGNGKARDLRSLPSSLRHITQGKQGKRTSKVRRANREIGVPRKKQKRWLEAGATRAARRMAHK